MSFFVAFSLLKKASSFFTNFWHCGEHKEIKDSTKISNLSKLTLTLIDLGYTYEKIGDNRRVLYDQVSIINNRYNYLRKIKSFRKAGYDIVYLDETCVNKSHVVLCLATKPLTCAHINSIGLSSQCRTGVLITSCPCKLAILSVL
jgi:hypothetical protein